jgi:hypothetical protein
MDREAFANLYQGPKRKRYLTAAANLNTGGVDRRYSNIRAFLKAEKWSKSAAGRIISPASTEYIVELGRYLQPAEHNVYRAFEQTVKYPIIMKGRTQEQRAEVIAAHWGSFKKPVAVGLDASKFDQHTSIAALSFEHSFYHYIYHQDQELKKLLRWQLRRKVTFVGEDGVVQWMTRGGRMSGDINTALGNCIISASMLVAYANEHGIKIRCVVDGDDCVAFMETEDLDKFLAGVPAFYQELGYRMVVEEPARELSNVEFCQSKMCFVRGRWLLVRNPLKAITQDHCWIEKGGLTWDEVCGATGLGGLSLYGDTPVLCAYYDMLARACPKPRASALDRTSWLRHVTDLTLARRQVPTAEDRAAFERSFGIPPSLQLALERWYDGYDLGKTTRTIINTTITPTTIITSSCSLLKHLKSL